VENWKRVGIVNIAVGSFITAFFLFGLGIAWLVPVMLADPGKFVEIVSQFSTAKLALLGVCSLPFLYGLFTIYRGVSILIDWKVSDAARGFINGLRVFVKDTGGPDVRAGKNGGRQPDRES
jgi:hypothetical protein